MQDAWPAESWYSPAEHAMHAAVAAPPLLYEPAAQAPDTAVRPVPAQYMPAVHIVAAVRFEEGQKLPAGHGVAARIAGCGQMLPEGQAVQDGDAAPPEEKEPAEQFPEGADRPVLEQKAPAGHAAQLDWPDRGCSRPAEHGVQDGEDAPEAEKEPGGQTPSGAERPCAEQKLPAVQGLQADWPERS